MMTITLRIVIVAAVAAMFGCASTADRPDAGPQPDGNGQPIDAFGGPKFGESCVTSTDCAPDGYCVDGPIGDVCTYGCDAGCPPDWNCRFTDVAGSLISLCVPRRFEYCKPCTTDVQCNGGVCSQLDGGGYCLPECPFEGSCPTGYTCGPEPSGQHPGAFCVPDGGSCTCNAAHVGKQRTCQTANANGTCLGLETCDPPNGGWVGCTAPTASPEICDVMDNDCDQLIDDGVSGSACAITNTAGSCPGVQVCTNMGLTCQGRTPVAESCNYIDDDCDIMSDETYPTVGASCSAGLGGCERFGVRRCTVAGTGTECSAVAGTPTAERCNGLDDNCNVTIDETFPTLGQSCSVGVGACARQGNQVCNAAGSGTACSVVAGMPAAMETCNGIDDDCDTRNDEGFRNLATNQYDKDTTCGSCTTDCTVLYNLPNASGRCSVATGTPQCTMVCAPNSFNTDGATANGCELALDTVAIYVSIDDPASVDDASCGLGPVGTGAANHPCLTIAQGIARANTTGRTSIRVANGIYSEAITIANGKNLLGGHRPDTWQRDIAGTGTLVTGAATIAATTHDFTVRATNITSATVFEGFVVIGSSNPKLGGNSYTIYVAGSTTNLAIRGNVLYGGRGGPGGSGSSSTGGTVGVDGIGRDSNPNGYDAFVTSGAGTCDASNNRSYTNGGAKSCGADDVSGGKGGGVRCAPLITGGEFSGIDGSTGVAGDPLLGGAAGIGSDAGDDARLLVQMGNLACVVPTNPDYGQDGEVGRDGLNGPSGAACSAPAGSIVGGHWVGAVAGSGAAGGNGGGGGGGGAGGGAYCDGCPGGQARLGGHGGGGGSGGCGSSGGNGGTAGGGAFTIFIVGGTAPTVTGNTLNRGEGGVGGSGGASGAGGNGGVGAQGGTSTVFCTGRAGRGGNGGDGGHGAGGGGGCGGGSFGIYTSGVGTPSYCTAGAANTISSGSGGAGGSGGYSLINTGGTGSTGVVATCSFN